MSNNDISLINCHSGLFLIDSFFAFSKCNCWADFHSCCSKRIHTFSSTLFHPNSAEDFCACLSAIRATDRGQSDHVHITQEQASGILPEVSPGHACLLQQSRKWRLHLHGESSGLDIHKQRVQYQERLWTNSSQCGAESFGNRLTRLQDSYVVFSSFYQGLDSTRLKVWRVIYTLFGT